MTRNLILIFVQSTRGKWFTAGLKSTFRDASSNLVTQPQLFLSVFQGEHGTRATVPQSLHLIGVLLECLAGLHQSFQLVLDKQTTRAGNFTNQHYRAPELLNSSKVFVLNLITSYLWNIWNELGVSKGLVVSHVGIETSCIYQEGLNTTQIYACFSTTVWF